MNEQLLVIGLFLLGVILRVVLPYLQTWLATRDPFDWRYLAGQAVGAAVVIIPFLGNSEWVDALLGSRPEAAVAVGWFAADVGREVQKLYQTLQEMREGNAEHHNEAIR